MSSLGPNAGFLILSTGKDRRPLLWECLASISRHYPDAPVHVITDCPVDVPFTWVRGGEGYDSRRFKTRLCDLSPFDVTVVLDDDTVIHRPFGTAEQWLDGRDIAMAPDASFDSLGDYRDRGRGGDFVAAAKASITAENEGQPYFSSGVMIFRKTELVSDLFREWNAAWMVHQQRDQQPLITAIATTGIEVAVLPSSMNHVRERHGFDISQTFVVHFWKDKLASMQRYCIEQKRATAEPHKLTEQFERLQSPQRRQMTGEQYRAIGATINRLAPCNVLVFGAGEDSTFWRSLNRGGRTLVVENDPKWILWATGRVEVLPVEYPTTRGVWLEPDVDVPGEIASVNWDAVIVDGPSGSKAGSPGRQVPIEWSMRSGKIVFVHDFNRPWEQKCCENSIGIPAMVIFGSDGRGDLAVFHPGKTKFRSPIFGVV